MFEFKLIKRVFPIGNFNISEMDTEAQKAIGAFKAFDRVEKVGAITRDSYPAFAQSVEGLSKDESINYFFIWDEVKKL